MASSISSLHGGVGIQEVVTRAFGFFFADSTASQYQRDKWHDPESYFQTLRGLAF